MTERLADHAIVITGATGIAAAAAERLGQEGARVFTISRTAEHCESLSAHLGALGIDHGWAVADLSDEGDAVRSFGSAFEHLGRIDGLLAVAGGSGRRFGDGLIDATSLDAWHKTLDLNLTTTFLSVREALRAMIGSGAPGSIAVVSSVLADHPSPTHFGTHAYAVAKGGQLALVRTAAAAYAGSGIRVNAIAPSLVTTPMSERAQTDPEVSAYAVRKQPLAAGFLPAGSVASAAAYLLSDDARHVTGQVILVDGGWSVTEASS